MMTSVLLAVDTTTEQCGVALAADGKVLAELCLSHGQTHSRHVLAAVDTVLSQSRVALGSVDAFAVTRGPGSFTGLRIGISTVKGLAFATGKPMVGISSLEVLARQAKADAGLICPMIDARRKEIYWALYRRAGDTKDASLVRRTDEIAGSLEQLAERIDGECLFIGNGALLYADRLTQFFGDNAKLAPRSEHAIRPAMLARLAWDQFQKGRFEDAQGFAPVYLRKSDAEISQSRRT